MRRIKDLMNGSRPDRPTGKRFLFDIVANKRNSIDVDKFDYLRRDGHYSGVSISCDTSRLMEFCKVRGGPATGRAGGSGCRADDPVAEGAGEPWCPSGSVPTSFLPRAVLSVACRSRIVPIAGH